MKLLLDTHAFLWFIAGDERLSSRARDAICDLSNERLLSIASVWEIAIKVGLGKLELPFPLGPFLDEQLASNSVVTFPISPAHAIAVATLPRHHRDPFDRLLASQALLEGLTLVSYDGIFDAYGVRRLA